MMIDSTMTVRFPAVANLRCTVAAPYVSLSTQLPKIPKDCRCIWGSAVVHVTSRRLRNPGGCNVLRQSCRGSRNPSNVVRRSVVRRVGGSVEPLRSRYHPSEDIAESTSRSCGDLKLSAPEITRTIVEVNTKATLFFPGLTDEEVEKSVLWPELPYLTDERGNIYFQMNKDEDSLQNLSSETNLVEVIIGLDKMDLMNDLDLFSSSDIDFGVDRIEDDEGSDDVYDDEDDDDEDEELDEDWASVLEELENDPDQSPGDWTESEIMRFSHPLYFANSLTEAAAAEPFDLMALPSASVAIKGLLRPTFIEEHTIIKRHIARLQSNNVEVEDLDKFVEDKIENHGVIDEHEGVPELSTSAPGEAKNSEATLMSGTSFYKLDMLMIQLPSDGRLVNVEVEDYAKAQPDALARSATRVISRLNAQENMAQTLKSLCWRCKGIGVEEASLASIDTLGFDVRVCSGTQIQTLRFQFSNRAKSEHDAESQIKDVLFPRSQLENERAQEQSDQTNVNSLKH